MQVQVRAAGSSSFLRSSRTAWAVAIGLLALRSVALGEVNAAPPQSPTEVRYVAPDDATRTSSAVVVPEGVSLAHTAQILPLDKRGSIIGPDRTDEQVKEVLDQLELTLKEVGSELDQVVKVNVYAARSDVLPAFRSDLAKRLTGRARPALSVVVGTLAHPEALVAVDAVATTTRTSPTLAPRPSGQRSGAAAAILPAGAKVYISGQAEPHADLAESTRRTLKSLEKSLAYLGLDKSHVVQLKAFMQPMSASAVVERELTSFFGAGSVPPFAYVEWRSGASMPIEIELIARAGPRAEPTALESITPNGMTASPVYSRVIRVNHGDLIYVSGLFGPPESKGTEQVEAIFSALKSILDETGSDFRHLAKATYYVTDDAASQALNDLRPKFYDAKRPPAASKAIVPGVGTANATVTVDMIGITRPQSDDPTTRSK